MSQIALATKAGLSKSSISAYVNGERVPDPASCDRIADAVGINLDVVLSQAGHRPQVERVPASDQKLATQIGNTLKFFVSTHIVAGGL